MKVTPIKTPLLKVNDDLSAMISQNIPTLPEASVLVVTSKIVGLSEGKVKKVVTGDRDELHVLVKTESELYIDPSESQYDAMLTIKNSLLAINAGIDQSNADQHYVLFPEKPFDSAQQIWQFLRSHYGVNEVGVVISDSKTFPLKWGTVGTCLAHCGFKAVRNRIGDPDLFGRELHMTKVNVAEGIAAAAVLEMGEADEQTPLCLVEDIRQIEFQNRPLSLAEIKADVIDIKDDVFAPVLTKADWKKGGK